jgi:hypothetical protein
MSVSVLQSDALQAIADGASALISCQNTLAGGRDGFLYPPPKTKISREQRFSDHAIHKQEEERKQNTTTTHRSNVYRSSDELVGIFEISKDSHSDCREKES